MLTERQAPFTSPYAIAGNSKNYKSKGPTAEVLKRTLAHLGFLPWNPPFDPRYNVRLSNAVAEWKRKRGLIPLDSNDGSWGKKAHDVMRATWYAKDGERQPAFDPFSQKLLQKEAKGAPELPSRVPDLGALWDGGLGVLDHDMTHMTTNILKHPAFDDAFKAGTPIIAPEDIVVFKHDTSASPGEAIYALGESELEWWIAHIDRDHPLGTKIAKGKLIGKVIPTSVGGGPHVHAAINIERLIGKGEQLLYGQTGHGPDYTHCPITIGEQLQKLL